MAIPELCPSVVCGVGGGMGSRVRYPVTSLCRVLSLEQEIKLSQDTVFYSKLSRGEGPPAPCLASMFQNGDQSCSSLEVRGSLRLLDCPV